MENLENADKKLSLLVEPRLKMALEDYVYKGDAQVNLTLHFSSGMRVRARYDTRSFEFERSRDVILE